MTETIIAYKFRLYPNNHQKNVINRTIGACRWVYNWGLSENKKQYENFQNGLTNKKFLSEYDLSKQLTQLKKQEEYSWLGEINSTALCKSLSKLQSAFDNFFKNRAQYPKKHKKQSIGSYTTKITPTQIQNINHGVVKLPKMEEVKIVTHRFVDLSQFQKSNNYVTISRNSIGEYELSIKILIEVPNEPNEIANKNNTIGVDVGLKDLAIISTGEKYHKFSVDKKILKRKKRLQRKLSRKIGSKKGESKSNNYIKLQKQIAKIDKKIERKKEQYQYNSIKSILDNDKITYIGLEDLNVKGMSRKGGKRKKAFNRSCANASLGTFITRIDNKAKRLGKKTFHIDRWNPSSKTCNNCGYVNTELTLNDRKWTCPNCGTTHDRDINASFNIRDNAIEGINNNRNLPKCIGNVKSVESETKLNNKNNRVSVTSALNETENSIQSIVLQTKNQLVDQNVLKNNTN